MILTSEYYHGDWFYDKNSAEECDLSSNLHNSKANQKREVVNNKQFPTGSQQTYFALDVTDLTSFKEQGWNGPQKPFVGMCR